MSAQYKDLGETWYSHQPRELFSDTFSLDGTAASIGMLCSPA